MPVARSAACCTATLCKDCSASCTTRQRHHLVKGRVGPRIGRCAAPQRRVDGAGLASALATEGREERLAVQEPADLRAHMSCKRLRSSAVGPRSCRMMGSAHAALRCNYAGTAENSIPVQACLFIPRRLAVGMICSPGLPPTQLHTCARRWVRGACRRTPAGWAGSCTREQGKETECCSSNTAPAGIDWQRTRTEEVGNTRHTTGVLQEAFHLTNCTGHQSEASRCSEAGRQGAGRG